MVGGLTGDGNLNMGMQADKVLQVRKKDVFTKGSTHSYAQMTDAKLPAQAQLIFRRLDGLESGSYMGKKQGAVLGELHAPGASGKQGNSQGLLQLLDGSADGRLTDKKLVSGLGDVAGEGGDIENTLEGESCCAGGARGGGGPARGGGGGGPGVVCCWGSAGRSVLLGDCREWRAGGGRQA